MHRKLISFLIILMLLPIAPAFADVSLALSVSPHTFSVGETVHLYLTTSIAGQADLVAVNQQGEVCATILDKQKVSAGASELTWDGMSGGQPLPEGLYSLRLTVEDMTVDYDVTIISKDAVPTGSSLDASAFVDEPTQNNGASEGTGRSAAGRSGAAMTPSAMSTYPVEQKHENCYWCTPMDIHDEAAVWGMLTAPVTVLEGEQKQQIIIRKEPSDKSEGVGVVTCASQSVHVLEDEGNGWTLIQCYSSSFHDSKVKAWNAFVTGYVPTNKLKTKKPAQDYGIVIDKLTQELYLFHDGKLMSTLLISTGGYDPNAKKLQPYNETRSGEFLFVSRVGEFRSDNMYCSMAIRFNSGDLIHEVPHVKNADGTKNFKNTEYKLGTRASHGCIRTQRLKNNEGINMTWLWNNLSLGTKMVIWEDYAGRQMDIPDASTPLYYNPNGGSSYHSADRCNGVKDEYLPFTGTFTYGELEDAAYQKLEACAYCVPPRRIAEIEAINTLHETTSPGVIPY